MYRKLRSTVSVFSERRLAVVTTLVVLYLLSGSVFGAASLNSDLIQYIPGEMIAINGSGFAPNEQIVVSQLSVSGTDGTVQSLDEDVLTADASGEFTSELTALTVLDENQSLRISATGQSSGLYATTEVVLMNSELTLLAPTGGSICVDSLFSGTYDIEAQLMQVCPDGGRAPIVGRVVDFYTGEGNCGVGSGQTFLGTSETDADGIARLTFAGSPSLYSSDLVSFRVKFDGEKAPSDSEPANGACFPDDRTSLSASNDCWYGFLNTGCAPPDTSYNIVDFGQADVFFVKAADLDRDNFTDVVFTGQTTPGLFVAYGNAGGELDTPVELLPITAASIELDFINSDTLMDIVAAGADSVYILYNLGGRQFTTSEFASGGTNIMKSEASGSLRDAAQTQPSVATGYFNQDEYIDLVIAPGLVLFGDSSGTFTGMTALPLIVDAVATGDLDHSGRDDIVATSGDSTYILIGDGLGNFVPTAAVWTGLGSLLVPPVIALTDFNHDWLVDFALVLPAADSSNQSLLTIALGNGLGGIASVDQIDLPGVAFNLAAADVNHDTNMDIVVAVGSSGQLYIYFGDGLGSFSEPHVVSLGTGSDVMFALATMDLDRDGNFDFVTGAYGGGNLVVALDSQADDSILVDEMWVYGLSDLDLIVTNPDGFVISQDYSTVAGSEYQRIDVNGDGIIDDRTLDFNLQEGEYCISAVLEPDASIDGGGAVSLSIGIDGSQNMTVADGYDPGGGQLNRARPAEGDTVTYCFNIAHINLVQPANGSSISISRPTFDWSALMSTITDSIPGAGRAAFTYEFQLDRYMDFRSPMVTLNSLLYPQAELPIALGNDSVYYWRFRFNDGNSWYEYLGPYAVKVTGLCCFGTTGNIDADPEGQVDIADVTALISYLFVSFNPVLECSLSGDFDRSGMVDVSDLTRLIQYVFENGSPLPLCP